MPATDNRQLATDIARKITRALEKDYPSIHADLPHTELPVRAAPAHATFTSGMYVPA